MDEFGAISSENRPPPPELRGSPWLVITLGSLAAFSPLAIDMYLPAFPRMAADLGVPAGAMGLTLSVFLVGLAAGQILWGTLADHMGRRGPLLAGCAAYVAAALVCARSETLGLLVAWRFIMGLGGSAGVVVSRAVVRDLYAENESARFYSLLMMVGGIAPIIAPSLGSLFLTHGTWRAIFWFLAAFGAASAAAVALTLPETLPRAGRAHGRQVGAARRYGRVLRQPQFLAYMLAAAFTAGVLFGYITGAPLLFIRVHHLSAQQFGLVFAGTAAFVYASGQTNRLLLKRFDSRRVLGVAVTVSAAASAALVATALLGWGGFLTHWALLLLCMGTIGLIFPNATAAAMRPFQFEAGSASALLGMMQYGLGAAAGATVGAMFNGSVLPMAGVLAACSLCAAMAVFAGVRLGKQQSAG